MVSKDINGFEILIKFNLEATFMKYGKDSFLEISFPSYF